MLQTPRHQLMRYGTAVLSVAVALILSLLLNPLIAPRLLLFFPAIAFSAWYGGLRPALVSIGLSIPTIVYFLIAPQYLWQIDSRTLLQLTIFGVSCLFISLLSDARRRAEETARKHSENLNVTLFSIGDAVIVTDDKGQVTFMNPVAEALTGWTTQQAHGQHLDRVFKIVNETTRAPVESPVTKVMREGKAVGLVNHTILIANDGRRIPIDDSGAPIRNSKGTIVGIVLVFRDISERREAEIAQARLAALVEFSNDAIFGKTLNGIILSWNQGAEQMYGYTPQEVIGKPVSMLAPADCPDEIPQIMERLRRGEVIERQETARVRKDGTRIDVSLTISPIRDSTGDIVAASTIARDVTERKQTEQMLRESEERFRMIADTAPVMIWMSGPDAQCTFFNKGWLDFTGRTMEQSIGDRWAGDVYPDDSPRCIETYRSAFNARQTFEMEYRLRNAKGDYCWVLDRGIPRFTSDGALLGYIGSAIDISGRKRSEEIQHFLAEASQVLASSLDYQTTLASVAKLAVPTMADWCTLHLIEDGGSVQQVAIAHVDPAKIEWAYEIQRRYPADPNTPNGYYAVLRSGKPEIYPDIPDEMLIAVAKDEEELRLLRGIGYRSLIIMPLKVGEQTIGVLQLVSTESGRHYGNADVALAEELARLAAVAVDNARLYRKAQQARQLAEQAAERTAHLQAVTAALAQVLTPTQAAHVVVEQSLLSLGAPHGLVALLTDDGQTLEVVYSTGYSKESSGPWQRMSMADHIPITDVVRSGQPFFVDSVDTWNRAYPALANVIVDASLVLLPLIVDRHPLGSMIVSFSEPRDFSPEDQAFMLALAQQCAQGIDRARLYAERQDYAKTLEAKVAERTEQLQQALIEAQGADRAKSTLLATVSHEMRTPLSSIIGFSNLILARQPEQQKLTEYTTFINMEARRLANLINDFLDLQRIESGREVFRFADLDIAELVRDIVAKQTLDENGTHTIRLEIDTVPPVYGDSNRLRQVMLNLLTNALKFSPNGSEVALSLRRENDKVVFSIHDQGIGIPYEEQGKLFENFYRGDAAERNRIPGTGLGLALCRRIIDAHHGHIWAESAGFNQGSTFSFAIPVSKQGQPIQPGAETPHDEKNLIAVIEDDDTFSTYLVECLAPEGYTIRLVHFAEATPDFIAQLDPSLILLDILNGNEQLGWPLLTQIKQHPAARHIPVIICSVLPDSGEAAALGASSYVSKPVDEPFLLNEINRLIGAPPHKVLIVDDDEAIRALLQDILAEVGYQPEIANDGQEAIDRLRQEWPDLIILDLLMPNIDGFTVLNWIRMDQNNPDIPIIAFTAAELTSGEQQILKERANTVAIKSSTSPQKLLDLIRRAIQVPFPRH